MSTPVRYIFLLLLGTALLISCGERAGIRKQLTEFRQTRVVIPDDMEVCNGGTVGMADIAGLAPMKMIVYYDSTECSACRIVHLPDLETLYDKAREDGRIDVLTVFSPKQEELEEVRVQLMVQDVPFPVYVDTFGSFARQNGTIPKEALFHSFMIDGEGRPVFVGNPANSGKVRDILLEVLDDNGH